MKIRIETVIKDSSVSRDLGLTKSYERFETTAEDFFLDGPVTRRVAVLDFDPDTGLLSAPVPFRPPSKRRRLGCYQVADPDNVQSPDMLKVSVFGTVLKTMKVYEEPDNLGRRLSWAFPGPQLLVVTRARSMRSSTALSHDIVAHETGHAILDGIAPDLYNAVSPQSLALHEAVADITALLMAFRLRNLRAAVLRQTRGLDRRHLRVQRDRRTVRHREGSRRARNLPPGSPQR